MSGIAFFILLVVLESSTYTKAAISFSPQCQYPGYAPGAVNKIQRTKAVKAADFESTILEQGLAYFNTGSGVTAATLGVIDAVGDALKSAPQLTAALGIITVGLGFLQSSPSPQDILDKAFESVQLLSDEVNVMMDQMKDYVDSRDLDFERDLLKNRYRVQFVGWASCAKESSVERVLTCQRRAVTDISKNLYHFQQLHAKFDQKKDGKPAFDPNLGGYRAAATWQWIKQYCGNIVECLSHYDVKKLEVGILVFRDYATLHLYALKTLEATLRKRPLKTNKVDCGDYKRFVGEMASRANNYQRYAKWAREWVVIRYAVS